MSEEYFGINKNIPRGAPEYTISRTELIEFFKCPWAWFRGRKFEGNASTDFGSLVDMLYLTPERFDKEYIVRPLNYPRPTKSNPDAEKPWASNATWCKNWIKEQKDGGLNVVTYGDMKKANAAVAVLRKDEDAQRFFGQGEKQTICRWEYEDSRTGLKIPLQCMLDGRGPTDFPFLADLKTARDASLEGFRRSGRNLRYDIQVAFYAWGHRECYDDRDTFGFVVCENTEPFPIGNYVMSAAKDCESGRVGTKAYGRDIPGYEEMLRFYCHCLKTQEWPSYTSEIQTLRFYE